MASCWVIVLPPCVRPPLTLLHTARAMLRGSTPHMGVKAPVLDREKGAGDVPGQRARLYRRIDDRPRPRDRRSVRREQGDLRRHDRFERFRQRRGERQPADEQDKAGCRKWQSRAKCAATICGGGFPVQPAAARRNRARRAWQAAARRALDRAFWIYGTRSCSATVLQSQYSISKWLMHRSAGQRANIQRCHADFIRLRGGAFRPETRRPDRSGRRGKAGGHG